MIMKNLRMHVLADIEANIPVSIDSPSGRGKSQWAKQTFKYLQSATKLNWGFQSLFLSTQSPIDLMGVLFKGVGEYDGKKYDRAVAALPLWMISDEGKPAWAYDRFMLVLDEFGQGDIDTKKASSTILLDGECGPHKMPPYSVRLALSNFGQGYGVTKDLHFLNNRLSKYRLTDDLDSTLEHWDKPYDIEGRAWKVMPVTRAFAASNPQVLFEPEPKDMGQWCTPRSLCAADRYVQVIKQLRGKIDPSDPGLMEGVSAKIGMAASSAYMAHLQFLVELPSYEDVVNDPAGTPKPGKPDLQMIMAYELASRAKKEHLAPVIEYMQRFPKDLAITFVRSIVARDKTVVIDPAMTKWVGKNATLLAILEKESGV